MQSFLNFLYRSLSLGNQLSQNLSDALSLYKGVQNAGRRLGTGIGPPKAFLLQNLNLPPGKAFAKELPLLRQGINVGICLRPYAFL